MKSELKELQNPMQTRLVFITPSYAKAVLEKNNVDNRRLNQMRVDAYARILLDGQWQGTHQGIAFGCNGNLIDGRYRLAAIAKANVSAQMLVSYNLEEGTKLIVDSGSPRTLGNRIALAGYDGITSKSIAVARILEYGVVASSQCAITAEDAVNIATKYKRGIDFALSCGSGRGYNAVVQSVVARASYTKSNEKLKRFVEVFISEVPTDKSESAALKLKRAIIDRHVVAAALKQTSGYAYTSLREYIYGLTENALSRFIKGDEVLKLSPVMHELYPIPDQ